MLLQNKFIQVQYELNLCAQNVKCNIGVKCHKSLGDELLSEVRIASYTSILGRGGGLVTIALPDLGPVRKQFWIHWYSCFIFWALLVFHGL